MRDPVTRGLVLPAPGDRSTRTSVLSEAPWQRSVPGEKVASAGAAAEPSSPGKRDSAFPAANRRGFEMIPQSCLPCHT